MARLFPEIFHGLSDDPRHGHRIGIAFLVKREFDTFVAVDPGYDFPLFIAADNTPHVCQGDNGSLTGTDHNVPDLFDGLKFVEGADQVLGFPVFELSACQVDILLSQAIDHLSQRNAHGCQLGLINLYLYFFFQSAVQANSSNPFEAFQFGFDFLFCQETQSHKAFLAIEPDSHDGIERGVKTK